METKQKEWKMDNTFKKERGVIVAGVGGQGAVTLARLILLAVYRAGFQCLQSEVHGLSQRGGAVSAHVVYGTEPVSSPAVMDGDADILIGMEPLETLRYVHMVKKDGTVISSLVPIKNMPNYPQEHTVKDAVLRISGVKTIDADKDTKNFGNKHAGSMSLLGLASNYLPVELDIWDRVLSEYFMKKGQKIVDMNVSAFGFGRSLI